MTTDERLDTEFWDDTGFRDELLIAVLPECLFDDRSGRYSMPAEALNRAEGFIAEAMQRRKARREREKAAGKLDLRDYCGGPGIDSGQFRGAADDQQDEQPLRVRIHEHDPGD